MTWITSTLYLISNPTTSHNKVLLKYILNTVENNCVLKTESRKNILLLQWFDYFGEDIIAERRKEKNNKCVFET